MTLNDVAKLLRPIRNQVANMVSRAVVRLVDDSTKVQALQLDLLDEETREEIEHVQNYGFTSVPFPDAEAVVLFVGGRRDHGLAVAVDDRRYRLKNLQKGEVAIYTDQGDSIVIKRGGTIEITAATKVTVNAPTVELAGNSDAVAMASKVNARCAAIETLLKTWTVVPNDGGAALKLAASTALASPASTASTKVKLS